MCSSDLAFVVAEALDGDSGDKSWRRFVGALFGSVGRARLVSFSDARFVSFSDGAVGSESKREAVHEVVSLSIDEETGTAKKDHLRLLERARACILRYYSSRGKKAPDDSQDPIPIQFLVVPKNTRFLVTLDCPEDRTWAETAMTILDFGLRRQIGRASCRERV